MKTSSTGNVRPLIPINGISASTGFIGKMMIGLALTAMIGITEAAPAFARNDRQDNRRYEERGRGRDRGHYVYERGRRVYRPYYGYREPVYVPPPVIYAPPPAPGISIWLPPIVIPIR